jgi:hypothetical protein
MIHHREAWKMLVVRFALREDVLLLNLMGFGSLYKDSISFRISNYHTFGQVP